MVTNLVNSRDIKKTDALKLLNFKGAKAIGCPLSLFISGI